MERLLTSSQMRSADEYTINTLKIPEEELVHRAGIAVAKEISKKFMGGRVLVCIGKGNNGEDGKIIAKYLSEIHGFNVAKLVVSNGILKLFERKFDIIVDCIFGTGLNKEVKGTYAEVIEKINKSGAYVVSCDIPSGINADNGKVMGVAVKADMTVAIQELKLGHFLNEGVDYSGQVIVKDIGISIWGEDYAKRLNEKSIQPLFPKLERNVNKGNFKKACVFGGSKNYPGSVTLAYNALSAFKMGLGYVYLAVPESLYDVALKVCPECVLVKIGDDGENFIFDKGNIDKLLNLDSIAFGMGVGVNEQIYKIIEYLLQNYKGKLVIDADGINAISKYGKEILKNKTCQVVLTPHVKEFSRLIGVDKDIILDNQVEYAKKFAREYNITLVLKNAVSIITDGTETYINTTGNSGMAKAGSGDVLSGITAGVLAKDVEVAFGSAVSAYLFGRAGDIALEEGNQYSLTASDVVKNVGKAINSLF